MKPWQWWIAVVFVISGPWVGFVRQPQWERVHWIPFTDPADTSRDVVSNVFLFVPFGWSYMADKNGGVRSAMQAALLAMLVSAGAEGTQLFSEDRYPSATDVAMAAVGTFLGAGAAEAWRRRPLP